MAFLWEGCPGTEAVFSLSRTRPHKPEARDVALGTQGREVHCHSAEEVPGGLRKGLLAPSSSKKCPPLSLDACIFW